MNLINNKIALSDKDYASGTTIFIKKNDEGSGVGAGYTIEIYNNGTKVETIYKDTRNDTLDVIKQYKQQYNTNRSFQNEIEVFVTYPEKDSVFEENKKENDKKEHKSEASMNSVDTMLMKQAGYIEQLLNRITNPSEPVKIRTAEEELPMPNDNINISNESVADEIINKLIPFAKKIIDNPNADESSKKNDLYNKIKKWLFSVNDLLKKQESLNVEEIKKIIDTKLKETVNKPEFALLKETLEKKPGNLEGKNQLDTEGNTSQEVPQQEIKASMSNDFWKFASNLKGEYQIEDVFNYYVEENKIEDRKAFWNDIEKEIEVAFNKEGMAFSSGNDDATIHANSKNIALNFIAGTIDEQTAISQLMPIIRKYFINDFNVMKNKMDSQKLQLICTNLIGTFLNNEELKQHFVDPKRQKFYKNFLEKNIPVIGQQIYNEWRKQFK